MQLAQTTEIKLVRLVRKLVKFVLAFRPFYSMFLTVTWSDYLSLERNTRRLSSTLPYQIFASRFIQFPSLCFSKCYFYFKLLIPLLGLRLNRGYN